MILILFYDLDRWFLYCNISYTLTSAPKSIYNVIILTGSTSVVNYVCYGVGSLINWMDKNNES